MLLWQLQHYRSPALLTGEIQTEAKLRDTHFVVVLTEISGIYTALEVAHVNRTIAFLEITVGRLNCFRFWSKLIASLLCSVD